MFIYSIFFSPFFPTNSDFRSTKAYLIAYLYTTLPRILRLTVTYRKSPLKLLHQIKHVLVRAAAPDKIPTFFFILLATYHLLSTRTSHKGVAAAISAFLAYSNYKSQVIAHSGIDIGAKRLDNISSELTAMVAARAVDTLIRPMLAKLWNPRTILGLRNAGDIAIFTSSCFVIMFSWFYYQDRMQRRYANWITALANMDNELLVALRKIRAGELVYGEPPAACMDPTVTIESNPEAAHLLGPMCLRYGIDPVLGNTCKTKPIPCRLVHTAVSNNCEIHALWRFYRGFLAAIRIYLPLNMLLAVRSGRFMTLKGWKIILKNSIRSSSFLGFFIFLSWYSVCLVRTRLGKVVYPKATPQQLENSWGAAVGSSICGLSICIEQPGRRPELALFVSAKAMDIAVLPKGFGSRCGLMDALLFASSIGVLVSRKNKVKGYFGKLIGGMF